MRSHEERVMRAARFDRYGGADVLEVRDVAVPQPRADEVLVRVHAAGLNPKDVMIRSGALRLQSGRAFARGTGFDFAGEVVENGPGVSGLAPGTRVWGFLDGTRGGTAADYAVVPRGCLARAPRGLGWVEAAAIPLVGSAALQALRGVARLRTGERVLIRGAGGGVGSAAIQVARALGAHVTAMARAGSLDHCRAMGAHDVVEDPPHPGDLGARAFDIFIDCAGRSPLRRYGRLLRRGGRWTAVAPSPAVYALTPISKLGPPVLPVPRFGFVVVRPVAADLEELGRLVDAGRLRMPISATYPLEDIGAAHADLETGPSRGKRVLVIAGGMSAFRGEARHA